MLNNQMCVRLMIVLCYVINLINKFILLLRKGVYPYEYLDSWEKSDENTLPPKKDFYSNLNLEDISDEDDTHAQKSMEYI